MAVVYVLKPIVDRQRPDGGSQSFPSGHSASAFAGAAFLQRRYGWSYGAPAYAVATFVAYSRVESKRHWTSDVIAGGGDRDREQSGLHAQEGRGSQCSRRWIRGAWDSPSR